MRRFNAVGTRLTFSGSAQVDRVAVTALLTIVEDEAIDADAFLINQVVDHGIHVIPAELLFLLVGGAISDNGHFTTGCIADGGSGGSQCSFGVITEFVGAGLEGDAGQRADALSTSRRLGRRWRLAIFRAEAFTNSIYIHVLLAVGWGDQFLVLAIRNTVTIRIQAYTMTVNRATGRGLLAIELISDAVAIGIRQYGLGEFHQAGIADFAVCVIQRIDPPQGLDGF